jgi:hypothetical protein
MSDEPKTTIDPVASMELLALLQSANDLNAIVDGPFNVRWSHNGVRLTDTPQWCAFYVAMCKANASAQPPKVS